MMQSFVHSSQTSPIQIDNSLDMIYQLQAPVTPEEEQRVTSMVEEESRAIAHARQVYDARRAAETHLRRDQAVAAAEETEQKRVAAEEAERRAREGSHLKASIYSICAVACLGAEFTLTLVTLPFLLNVPQWSVQGFMLALAPTTAVIVLDQVLARLVENPRRKMRRVLTSAWRRAAATAVMAIFWVTLGAANVYTVFLLADARERATEIRSLSDEDMFEQEVDGTLAAPNLDEHTSVVRKAVIAVSLCVAIDGALFTLLALAEIRACRRKKRLRMVLALRERERQDTLAAVVLATSDLAEAELNLFHSRERAQAEADRFRSERAARLTRAKRWPTQTDNSPALVHNILTSSVGFGERRPAVRPSA